MADEHFFPAPFFTSSAPCFGMMLPWSASSELPADSATAAHFHSALSSLVSSPAHGAAGDEDAAIGDLIGRLGTICNTAASANNSCYSTPLSSPPHGAAPGLDQAAGSGRLSRVASSMSLGSGAARKRKAASGEHGKLALATNNGSSKRSKDAAAAEEEEEKPEPGKDYYIRVRARRGQATDSHSLAERVRREKISERMKLLQSLVPGCDKITGKAVMLDEIINYVQSLQRQVELLSMKLSTMDDDVDAQPYLPPSRDRDLTTVLAHHQDAVHPATTESCTGSSIFRPGFGGWDDLQSVVHHRHDQHPAAAAAGHCFHAGRTGGQQQTARQQCTTT